MSGRPRMVHNGRGGWEYRLDDSPLPFGTTVELALEGDRWMPGEFTFSERPYDLPALRVQLASNGAVMDAPQHVFIPLPPGARHGSLLAITADERRRLLDTDWTTA